jgi:UDP-N-acetylmuramate--alanine ligase
MPDSAEITIDKFQTLEILRRAGLPTAAQLLVKKADYEQNPNPTIAQIEAIFNYPLIAKPMDDGCSSAVKLLKNTAQMRAYLNLIFRDNEDIDATQADILHLKHKEEFPQKSVALIETLIVKEKAAHFLEITGGLLTHFNSNAECDYLMFEPSETLAGGEILSLEEKFLAGEGQNITPARFTPADKHFQFNHAHISQQVKTQLKQAALALKVTGYARIDAFVRIFEDGKAEVIVIEVNSLPGMTPATCIFHQCAIAGYKPYDFIAAILNFGKIRQQQLSLQPF